MPKRIRDGQKRLCIWLSEDHPIFKVPKGERTKAIQNLGNLEIAMVLIESAKREILDNLQPINHSVAMIETMLRAGQVQTAKEHAPTGSDVSKDDGGMDDIYKDFGGIQVEERVRTTRRKGER